MKALRSMVFENVQNMLEITPIQDPDIPGFQVALEPVVQWLVRELRLHGQLNDEIELSLKLDGRPFFGKNCIFVLLLKELCHGFYVMV